MAANEQTSPYVASIASRGLDDPARLSRRERLVAYASALTQCADRRRANPVGYEETSRRIASLAGRGLDNDSLALDELRAVCGSLLTQAPDKHQGNAMARGAHPYYNALATPLARAGSDASEYPSTLAEAGLYYSKRRG